MTDRPDPWYSTLILRLAEMESVELIERSLRETRGLEVGELRTTVQEMIADERRKGRPAERALLGHMATIINRALPEAREKDNRLSAAAMAAISRARTGLTPLAAYRALVEFREEFTEEAYRDLCNSWLTYDARSIDFTSLSLLYLVALASGRLTLRVDSILRVAQYRHEEGADRAARLHFRRAVRIARNEGNQKELFWAASGYASWLGSVENYALAADMYQEAIDAALLAFPEAAARLVTLRARWQWAVILRTLGRYRPALDIATETLDITAELSAVLEVAAKVMFVPATPELDESLLRNQMLRGHLYMDIGELDLAEDEFDRAAELAQTLNLPDQAFEALTSAATVTQRRRDHRAARRRYARAVSVAEELGDAARIAAAYNNLGGFQLDIDARDEAFESYANALYHAGNAGAPTRTTCITLIGLGDTFQAFGSEDAAVTCYEMAFERAVKGPPDSGILFLLALRLMENERWWDADRSQRFDEVMPELAARTPPAMLAPLISAHARLRVQAGSVGLAVGELRNALDVISAQNPEAPELTSIRLQLGRLLAGERQSRQEAFSLLSAVLNEQRARLADVSLTERKSELIAESISARGALIGLLLDHGSDLTSVADASPVERAFALHELAKAPSLAAHLGRVSALQPESVPPELVELESRLLALARSTVIGSGRSEQSRRRRLREIEERLRDCWQEMRPYADHYVRLRSGQPAIISELQALVKESAHDVALASFFCDEETTTCFILQADDEIAVTRLPLGRERWATAGKALRRLFNGALGEFPPYPPILRDRPERRNFAILDELSADLIALLKPVRDPELLCVAPHGPLHVIPFHALRGADGRYLIERFGITYTPSLTTLLYALGSAPADVTTSWSAMVAGVASKDDSHPEYFEHDEGILGGLVPSVRIMNGPQAAAPEQIFAQLPDHDIVHLTCHGFFDDRDPLQSGLILGDGRQRPPREQHGMSVRQRRPYLITAEELLTLRLKAELVTLRACSTALVGERNAGDEFDGLTRSFIHAGARAVLAGQWNVDQQSSQALLSAFYENWLRPATRQRQRLQKWQALRLAQLEFLNSTAEPYLAHPYHWAPLALLGDWR